jgi:hypothetical protein
MRIDEIKNTFLRRLLILILAPVGYPIVFLYLSIITSWGIGLELKEDFIKAWKGRIEF